MSPKSRFITRWFFSALQVPVVIISVIWCAFVAAYSVLGWIPTLISLVSGHFIWAGGFFILWCLTVGFMNTLD